MINNLGG